MLRIKKSKWEIGKNLLSWIRENIGPNRIIIELGSGKGSEWLSNYYKVYSVEHDPKFVDKYNTNYIYAPIKNGWYDTDVLKKELPNHYDIILVDGPPGYIGRSGFFENIHLFNTNKVIIFDDTNRSEEDKLCDNVAHFLNRSYKTFSDEGRKFSIINYGDIFKIPKVLVVVPNYDGWIHKRVSAVSLSIFRDKRAKSVISYPTNRPSENNRNQIIKDFLKKDYDYLISIDADNPPRKNPLDLIFLNKDIIGCPTPVWHYYKKGEFPIYLNGMKRVKEGFKEFKNQNGLQQVDAIGAGCFVVKRNVLEKLSNKKPFHRVWHRDGTVNIGSDYAFCDKVRKHGFKIWAHYDYLCSHYNELDLVDVLEVLRGRSL